jgi:hypothetical protein
MMATSCCGASADLIFVAAGKIGLDWLSVEESNHGRMKNPGTRPGQQSGSSGFQVLACHTTSFDRSPESPTRRAVMRNLDAMESAGLGQA